MTEVSPSQVRTLAGVDALVTGSSRGLGFGIARAFAEAGARVWMVAEGEPELHEAAGEITGTGGRVEARVVDLTDARERSSLTHELLDAAPGLRVVVNNAAILARRPLADIDADHWDRTLAVNLTAPVFLTRDLLPLLEVDGGSVINVSSRAGVLAFEDQVAYCASKFGLEAFTRCLAMELADTSVSVNSITPGLRIKPTSLTRAESAGLAAAEQAAWYDPIELSPAFTFLAGLRGQVSGYRFDARVLSEAINRHGVAHAMKDAHRLAEYVPESHP